MLKLQVVRDQEGSRTGSEALATTLKALPAFRQSGPRSHACIGILSPTAKMMVPAYDWGKETPKSKFLRISAA